MSRLARVLVTGGVLVVLSLGGTAHAQDAQPPSPPGGDTQPAQNPPAQNPPAQNPPAQNPPAQNPPAQNPPAQNPPAQDPGTTATTHSPVRPILVTVSPREGRPGTTVRIVIEPRGTCDPFWTFFQDRKGRGLGAAAGTKPVSIVEYGEHRAIAQYTVSNSDAVGWGRFAASCDATTDTYRITWASFKVLPASASAGNPNVYHKRGGKPQVPSRVDTGLGPTADGGIDPVWLLLPAGLLLIALAAALRLRQAAISRRR